MKKGFGIGAAVVALAMLGHGVWAQGPPWSRGSNRWIVEAASDEERFQRIERYLRGFDQPMWEVGERYEKIHAALLTGNFELASYHWAKIKLTTENGALKRPARAPNSEAFLLSGTWASVDEALRSGDPAKAWKGFAAARISCIGCHVAEGVGYMNDQPMFTDLVPREID